MEMKVEYLGNKKFKAKVREHEIITALPKGKGGGNSAATPPELMVVSLGTCVGYFVLGYMKAADLDPTGLSIDVDWEMVEDGSRIKRIDASISVPNAELGKRKKAIVSVAKKCIIHETLHNCPEMEVSVKGE